MADIPSRRSSIIAERFMVEGNTLKRAIKSNPKDRIEIEIGDSKQPDFKPQAKISRWDNEVNFSLRAQEHPEAIVRTEGKLIKYITPDYEVHQYELDPGEIGEDGGLEFEWVLPKKPASNVLTATIQTKELDFFYQPALTQEEIDEGSQRPENVVGSYAVYHKTKGGMNRADGMEYKTGKAFHIYRPKVTDKKGKETWAELNIDEASGVLSVTIPQEFLDKAVYPVVVDPTFGYTSKGGTEQERANNNYYLSLFTGAAGTLTSISTYYKHTLGASQNVHSAVYLNTDNSLVDETTVDSIGSSFNNWTTQNLSGATSSAVSYLLALQSGSSVSNKVAVYHDLVGTGYYDLEGWNNSFKSTLDGKKAYGTRQYSIYATYSVASASDIKKLSSIAQASLKKVSSIAEASVKKVSGVANV